MFILKIIFSFYYFRLLYKTQKLLSVGNPLIAGASQPQDSDSLWSHRRRNGINPLVPLDNFIYEEDNQLNEDASNVLWTNDQNQKSLLILVILTGIIILIVHQLCCTKRHRRNRAVGKIQRVIQAITVKRVPAI